MPTKTPSIVPVALGLVLLLPACKGEPSAAPDQGPGEASASTPAGPALWTLRDEDTTIYLFGTVHVLRPETSWRYPGLEAAFDEAKVVYFEADVGSTMAQAKMVALLPSLGMYGAGETLSAALGEAHMATLTRALDEVGLSAGMVDSMRPWLAAMTLETKAMVSRGYDPNSGVEAVLGDEAKAAGKQLRYFETAEEQLGFFAGLPEDDQISFLVDTAEAVVDEPGALDELVDAWAAGDVDELRALVEDDDSTSAEAVHEVLLVNRNRNWVGQLQAVLADEPGVFFVAVGAAHLIGEDGVPAMLRSAGVAVDGP